METINVSDFFSNNEVKPYDGNGFETKEQAEDALFRSIDGRNLILPSLIYLSQQARKKALIEIPGRLSGKEVSQHIEAFKELQKIGCQVRLVWRIYN